MVIPVFHTPSEGRPEFTVISATYNRGRHIIPTVLSVLGQSFQGFEFYIIGDFCADDTAQHLQPFLNDRVHWINLQERGKSQSYPNNAGLKLARGRYVAYIGHDDIWAPNHLESLHECFATSDAVSFAVSGCLTHGPADSNHYRVTGIFEEDSAKFEHFFPPSSLAHKLSVVEKIGYWRDPLQVKAPVDCDLLLRAAEAGMHFSSTRKVTAHKFTAALRYLSYMEHTSHEQEHLLRILSSGDEAVALISGAIASARENGRFMTTKYEDYDKRQPGAWYRTSLRSRGVERPPLRSLNDGATIQQTTAYAGLDWQPLRQWVRPYRMSGENPRPKLLIPVTHFGPVEVHLEIVKITAPHVLEDLVLRLNGAPTPYRIWNSSEDTVLLTTRSRLKEDDYSVLQFDLTPKEKTDRSPGRIGVANIRIVPVSGDEIAVHT